MHLNRRGLIIGDQLELDFGGQRNPDGQGFAVRAYSHTWPTPAGPCRRLG